MYDFILFTPFNRSRFIGAYKVAKILRDQGYSVKVVDFIQKIINERSPERDQLLMWLQESVHKKTVFGFSGTFMNYAVKSKIEVLARKLNLHNLKEPELYPTLARRKFNLESDGSRPILVDENLESFILDLKSDFPNNKIVIGGAGFTSEFLYRNLPIDHLFLGYSEDTARKQLVDIFNGEKVDGVIHSSPFEVKYDFHNSGNIFHKSDFVFPNETLPLEISRGCRFKCKFCGFALIGRKVTDKYIRHGDKVFNELIHNYELFGTTNYNILCDTFNETNEKLLAMKSVFEEFKKATGEQLKFNSYLRLELMHRFPEQIGILRDMGIVATNLGIESLYYPAAKAIGKGIQTKDVYDTVSKMRKSWGPEARIHSGFIIGLPHETRETSNEWLTSLYNKELDLTSWKIAPLRINTNRASEFSSEFDKNANEYGYKMTSVANKGNWINEPDGSELWENEHWSFAECDSMAIEWTKKFNDDGIVNYTDHPWGYMNFKNGITEIASWGPATTAAQETMNKYTKQFR